jgi:hypothetical protein
MTGELKLFGGACQVEIVLFHRAGDQFALDPVERIVERFVRRAWAGAFFCRRASI